jgi:hypothetical protein
MKEDILDRLRAPHGYFGRTIRCQAATEIERLRGALTAETERCAKIAEGFENNRAWVPGSLYDTLRREVAADIRKARRD